jgi:hypothetical protein
MNQDYTVILINTKSSPDLVHLNLRVFWETIMRDNVYEQVQGATVRSDGAEVYLVDGDGKRIPGLEQRYASREIARHIVQNWSKEEIVGILEGVSESRNRGGQEEYWASD